MWILIDWRCFGLNLNKLVERFQEFDDRVAASGCGIKQRGIVATAVITAYCSVLRFTFQGQLLPRGWIDCLIMGDTRCGKSAIAKKIAEMTALGDFFEMAKVSYAGLVGACISDGQGRWLINWGKIPLNHGRLIIADELSNWDIDTFRKLTGLRSSGVADIVQAATSSTKAGCRKIFLSNPRDQKAMSSFTWGVQGVPDVAGAPEVIARFDYALVLNKNDVPEEVLNQVEIEKPFDLSTWEDLRNLFVWAWSIKPEQVEWTQPAYEACLSIASLFSKEYAGPIFLCEPNEMRIRVARIAVACAVRCFSEQGGRLIVNKLHVEWAEWFLRHIYTLPSMDFTGYARFLRMEEERCSAAKVKVKKVIVDIKGENYEREPWRILYSTQFFTLHDIQAFFDIETPFVRKIISTLQLNGCIEKKNNGYCKTKHGIEVIKEIMK